MLTLKRRVTRGFAAGVAGALVAGAASVLAVAPAQAAPATGSLTWNISEQFIDHLSSRTLDGATFDEAAKTFDFPASNVSAAADGTVTQTFSGSVKGAFAMGGSEFYSVTVADPVVEIAADGSGEVRATVSAAQAASGRGDAEESGPAEVKVVEFDSSSVADGTTTIIPNWDGVIEPGSATATGLGITDPAQPVEGRAFAPEFIGALVSGVRAHFYWSRSGEVKRPGNLSITAQATPTASASVTSASYEDGIQVKVEGEGFTAGDMGIYALLAPADTVIDFSDRETMSAFPTVYVMPQGFVGDTFTTVISAETDSLEAGTQYAVFTLRAHGLPDRSQDTKTLVDVDWTQLEAPVPAKKVKTTTKVTKLKHAKKAAKFTQIRVRARVNNVAPGKTKGKVRIVIKQGKKNVRVVKGVKLNKNGAINRVVKGLGKKVNKKGQYRVVVRYTGTKKYAKSKAVKKFRLR